MEKTCNRCGVAFTVPGVVQSIGELNQRRRKYCNECMSTYDQWYWQDYYAKKRQDPAFMERRRETVRRSNRKEIDK